MRDIASALLGIAVFVAGIEYSKRRCQDTTYVTVGCDCEDEDGEADEESAPPEPDGGKALTVAEAMGWAK